MKTALLTAAEGTETGLSVPSTGGSAIITATGTFDAASIAIEVSLDGVTWEAVHDANGDLLPITEASQDVYLVEVKQEMSIRAVTSGGGGSTSLTVYLVQ